MNKNNKQTFQRAINYRNYNAPPVKKPDPVPEKPAEIKIEVKPAETKEVKRYIPVPPQESMVSQERLQEAIIWSEILGKPISKRRKRRYNGDEGYPGRR